MDGGGLKFHGLKTKNPRLCRRGWGVVFCSGEWVQFFWPGLLLAGFGPQPTGNYTRFRCTHRRLNQRRTTTQGSVQSHKFLNPNRWKIGFYVFLNRFFLEFCRNMRKSKLGWEIRMYLIYKQITRWWYLKDLFLYFL